MMTTAVGTPLRTFDLYPSLHPGGIGVWGALPAIYDTTSLSPEHGVHVHARKVVDGKKEPDESFDLVNVVLPSASITIREGEAAAYVAAAVLGLPIAGLRCPYCSTPHLDEGHFAVHPHQRHICASCNREFLEAERSVGNPIMLAKSELGDAATIRPTVVAQATHRIDQADPDCTAGLQIWGSNPAIIWTTPRNEEEGIHVHGYRDADERTIDGTYASVEIDGIKLDAAMVRVFMIQQSLKHLGGAIQHVRCAKCNASHFDASAPFAVEPHQNHPCAACGQLTFTQMPVISNPIVDALSTLYANAARAGFRKNPPAP